jgi:hypothetical protein
LNVELLAKKKAEAKFNLTILNTAITLWKTMVINESHQPCLLTLSYSSIPVIQLTAAEDKLHE